MSKNERLYHLLSKITQKLGRTWLSLPILIYNPTSDRLCVFDLSDNKQTTLFEFLKFGVIVCDLKQVFTQTELEELSKLIPTRTFKKFTKFAFEFYEVEV